MFTKIVDDLGIYYKIGLTTDFTGKLFNEMYGWLGFSQDKLNDVVLTPSYVAKLLVKLASNVLCFSILLLYSIAFPEPAEF